jgi:hypothetical protein
MDGDWHNALANETGMICSDRELLANITTLPEVHWWLESGLC